MPASRSSTDRPATLPENLLALAPTRLRNHRELRYEGGDVCIALTELAAPDQTRLRRLYQGLSDLLDVIAAPSTDDTRKWEDVVTWSRSHDLETVMDEVHTLGLASHEEHRRESLSKAMHDVRGGALSPLLGRLQLLDRLPRDPAHLKTLFVLTRDHLKIMRNAVLGLDDPRREADREPKVHEMRLILEKWHDSVVGPQWQDRPLRMEIDCRHDGPLAECCLESAAIDRIFYNLAANAARHAVGGRLDMTIFPVPGSPDGGCLRFVLSNEVGKAEAEQLKALGNRTGADSTDLGSGRSLFALFEPEVSSTGSGFGLVIVADFVAAAFGLQDRAEALRERYVGAILDGNTFRVWFHWPKAYDGPPHSRDDYHHPEDSLSEPGPGKGDAVTVPTPRPLRIFVVENHPDTSLYLRMYLEGYGHTVFTAGTKQEALESVPDAHCDVLIADIGLADGNGWELLSALREQGNAPAFAIAMSGFGLNADRRRSEEAGFRHHLLKPIEPEEFDRLLKIAASELRLAG